METTNYALVRCSSRKTDLKCALNFSFNFFHSLSFIFFFFCCVLCGPFKLCILCQASDLNFTRLHFGGRQLNCTQLDVNCRRCPKGSSCFNFVFHFPEQLSGKLATPCGQAVREGDGIERDLEMLYNFTGQSKW